MSTGARSVAQRRWCAAALAAVVTTGLAGRTTAACQAPAEAPAPAAADAAVEQLLDHHHGPIRGRLSHCVLQLRPLEEGEDRALRVALQPDRMRVDHDDRRVDLWIEGTGWSCAPDRGVERLRGAPLAALETLREHVRALLLQPLYDARSVQPAADGRLRLALSGDEIWWLTRSATGGVEELRGPNGAVVFRALLETGVTRLPKVAKLGALGEHAVEFEGYDLSFDPSVFHDPYQSVDDETAPPRSRTAQLTGGEELPRRAELQHVDARSFLVLDDPGGWPARIEAVMAAGGTLYDRGQAPRGLPTYVALGSGHRQLWVPFGPDPARGHAPFAAAQDERIRHAPAQSCLVIGTAPGPWDDVVGAAHAKLRETAERRGMRTTGPLRVIPWTGVEVPSAADRQRMQFRLELPVRANDARHAPDSAVQASAAVGFSVSLWVRAAPEQAGFTPLFSSKPWSVEVIDDFTSNHNTGRAPRAGLAAGWCIALQPDGSWLWNVGDGETRLDYLPTVGTQPVADGEWHHLAAVVDRQAGTVRLFHDGRTVAVYDLGALRSLPAGAAVAVDSGEVEIESASIAAGVLLRPEDVLQAAASRRPAPPPAATLDDGALRVLAWNIWHGGRRDGEEIGVRRVVDVIRASGADVVAMQETYGSGPRIADALGWTLYLRSSNISVLSRFPIIDTHAIFEPFHSGGVTLDLGAGRRATVFSIWLRHLPDYDAAIDDGADAAQLILAEAPTRLREINAILSALLPHVRAAKRVPLVVAGDFNSPSHLDWTEAARDHNRGLVVRWPVSRAMANLGFVDAFRRARPDPVAEPGRTWSPRFTDARQDRIDYVYVLGDNVTIADARMLDQHAERWPSDHAAVLATLRLR